jgi:hypothetical protein
MSYRFSIKKRPPKTRRPEKKRCRETCDCKTDIKYICQMKRYMIQIPTDCIYGLFHSGFHHYFSTISGDIEVMQGIQEKKHPHFEKAKGLMKERGLLVEMTTRDNGEITYTVRLCNGWCKNDLEWSFKKSLSITDEEFNKEFKELLYRCDKEVKNLTDNYIKDMITENMSIEDLMKEVILRKDALETDMKA